MSTPSQRVVAFGELLLCLKSPQHERLLQHLVLEASFRGSEFNVLASLAGLGLPASFVSVLPNSPIGLAARAEMRRSGVECEHVISGAGRMGLYFLESGADQRPSQLIYDRADSAFARAQPVEFDWPRYLSDTALLHVGATSAALGERSCAAARVAVLSARQTGIRVSVEVHAQPGLWPEDIREVRERLSPVIAQASVLFADAPAWSACLSVPDPGGEARANARFDAFATAVLAEFPQVRTVVTLLREGRHGDEQRLAAACLPRGGTLITTPPRIVRHVVERAGTRDAFMSGVLYGTLQGWAWPPALEFGLAAAALKHTIPDEVSRFSAAEVQELLVAEDVSRSR